MIRAVRVISQEGYFVFVKAQSILVFVLVQPQVRLIFLPKRRAIVPSPAG
jgi:hypothetical protein